MAIYVLFENNTLLFLCFIWLLLNLLSVRLFCLTLYLSKGQDLMKINAKYKVWLALVAKMEDNKCTI